jgi:hypothetical protein
MRKKRNSRKMRKNHVTVKGEMRKNVRKNKWKNQGPDKMQWKYKVKRLEM